MTMLLSAFPNQYNLNVAERMVERWWPRGAQLPYLQYVSVQSTNTLVHTSDKVSTFGAMGEWPDGTALPVDMALAMGLYTQTLKRYGEGFKVGPMLVRYGSMQTVMDWADSLIDSAWVTLRAAFASLLNNGFSSSYAYREAGVALISASHTTAGGTRSNILAAASALTFSSWDALRQVAAAHVDYRGKLTPLRIDQMIVPAELEVVGMQIKGSPMEPFTSDHQINPLAGGGITMDEFLTSATAWFGRDSTRKNLTGFVGLEYTPGYYREQSSESDVFYGKMDFSYGADDWVGLLGSAGV